MTCHCQLTPHFCTPETPPPSPPPQKKKHHPLFHFWPHFWSVIQSACSERSVGQPNGFLPQNTKWQTKTFINFQHKNADLSCFSFSPSLVCLPILSSPPQIPSQSECVHTHTHTHTHTYGYLQAVAVCHAPTAWEYLKWSPHSSAWCCAQTLPTTHRQHVDQPNSSLHNQRVQLKTVTQSSVSKTISDDSKINQPLNLCSWTESDTL